MKNIRILIVLVLLPTIIFGQKLNVYSAVQNNKPEDRICFTLYTVDEQVLKLTAQFYPIKNWEPFEASLEIYTKGEWQQVATTRIVYPGYTAPFRLEDWDDTKAVRYRVVHNQTAYYEGTITKNPQDEDEFVMAAFSCNSVYPKHDGNISKVDIIKNIQKLEPDLLFFAGDQVYDHSQHLLYWLQFGRDFGDITRHIPTICIVDDHDVGQANIWGQGGIQAENRRGIEGGYYMPVEYVKEVERAQTSHLPDPYDATPIEQGIGVYYTDLKWGGIGFAILEDRKFKSGMVGVAEQNPDIFPDGPLDALFDPEIDTRRLDVPGADLLGKRQLDFLEHWTTDWKDTEMKSVLSQTIFAMANNYTGKHDNKIIADFDTNGWPQTGRNKALAMIRKSYATMIAGDQHLASVIKHGIHDWNDAGYSFCVPAIANYWMRWWDPDEPGINKAIDAPDYTGEFLDGFKNKITVHAVANPTEGEIGQGGKLSTRAAGYGIVRYDKPSRTTTFECWGRNIDITDPKSRQYEGWPVSIKQSDNHQVINGYELPILRISKADQVVTVRDSYSNEVVSSLRIKGKVHQPCVQLDRMYTIEIGEGIVKYKIIEVAASKRNQETIQVNL